MRFTTKQIHAGVEIDPTTGSILTPIFQTTTYVQPSVDEYLAKGFSYSRAGNPTVRALERRLTALEAGEDTVCFATGMAAIQAVMLAFLNAGDHCIISDVAYGGTYRIATKIFSRFGVDFSFADTSDPEDVKRHLRDNTRLVLIETPANPTLKVTNIQAISDVLKDHPALHCVDNTFLTPFYQRPFELGADLIVHSTTKYFDGHNATVGGAVVSKTAELDDKVRFIQKSSGTIMSPQVAFLTLQGCLTLSMRIERQSQGAMEIAKFLETHPKVDKVAYPGLETHPQYAISRKQATGFGAMVWFEVHGGTAAGKKLMDNIKLWSLAENLGSAQSLVTHPVTMTHADVDAKERARVGITDGLVRLSVGLEDVEDLIDALKEALDIV